MTFRQRDTTGFRHRLRVRIGTVDGPKGRLLRCEKRDGGHYWKVRLDTGEWVWPDGILVDGPGEHLEHACLDCRLPFRGNVGDLLCQACQDEAFGTDDQRAHDGERSRTSTIYRRRWASRHR